MGKSNIGDVKTHIYIYIRITLYNQYITHIFIGNGTIIYNHSITGWFFHCQVCFPEDTCEWCFRAKTETPIRRRDALLFCKDGQSNDLALPEHLDAPCPEMVMIAIYCHPIGHGG